MLRVSRISVCKERLNMKCLINVCCNLLQRNPSKSSETSVGRSPVLSFVLNLVHRVKNASLKAGPIVFESSFRSFILYSYLTSFQGGGTR
jgi:hypothetical protein